MRIDLFLLKLDVFVILAIITITTTISTTASVVVLSTVIIWLEHIIQVAIRISEPWLCSVKRQGLQLIGRGGARRISRFQL